MSTYTPYNVNTKEYISRIRNPGNASDGICPDKVIFTNNGNAYYGSFFGRIVSADIELSDVSLDTVDINNATLSNASMYVDGNLVKLADEVYLKS